METEKLIIIVNQIRFNKDLDPITELLDSHDLRVDLEFDSLDLAELTVRIESAFGVDVFEDGVVQTIAQIINKLNKR